jgi:hypothetical protein
LTKIPIFDIMTIEALERFSRASPGIQQQKKVPEVNIFLTLKEVRLVSRKGFFRTNGSFTSKHREVSCFIRGGGDK